MAVNEEIGELMQKKMDLSYKMGQGLAGMNTGDPGEKGMKIEEEEII